MAFWDRFRRRSSGGHIGPLDPPADWSAVTKSDSTTFDPPTRCLVVGGAGNLVVDTAGGQTDVTFVVVAGQTIVGEFTKVKAATTATSIVRGW